MNDADMERYAKASRFLFSLDIDPPVSYGNNKKTEAPTELYHKY